MGVMSMQRATACEHEARHLPEKAIMSGVARTRSTWPKVKKKVQISYPKQTSGDTESVVAMSGAQPARAPVERSSKGQMLVVRDDVQRVTGALAALARHGDIDQAQSSAAERWYRDYVMGVIGAHDPESQRSGKASDIHTSMLARTAAVGRCRVVRNGLGLCGEVRLKLLLIDEFSFSVIAAKLLPNDINGRKKIAAQMTLLLEQLSELYATLDRRLDR